MRNVQLTSSEKGPFSYENWQAALAGEPAKIALEYSLFTDAHVVGDATEGFGPYQFINAEPRGQAYYLRPTIVLRVHHHDYGAIRTDTTDVERYHGGVLPDEIAALLSLCLGVRLKSSGVTRLFERDGDQRGRPVSWDRTEEPSLPTVPVDPIVPNCLGVHSFFKVDVLRKFPSLLPKQAIALVRAARLYQEALWIVEATPELAWLMFVSAVEVAAQDWRTEIDSPLERLKISRPELEALLRSAGDEEFVQKVAEQIAPYMGATTTFRNFILNFLPSPPTVRPLEPYQLPWSQKGMKKIVEKVYQHRSRALHGGLPFPAPMCLPPHYRDEDGVLSEIPTLIAMSTRGGVWLAKDAPITLHIFEYIVRNSLLQWWQKLLPKGSIQNDRDEDRESINEDRT